MTQVTVLDFNLHIRTIDRGEIKLTKDDIQRLDIELSGWQEETTTELDRLVLPKTITTRAEEYTVVLKLKRLPYIVYGRE